MNDYQAHCISAWGYIIYLLIFSAPSSRCLCLQCNKPMSSMDALC